MKSNLISSSNVIGAIESRYFPNSPPCSDTGLHFYEPDDGRVIMELVPLCTG